MRLPLRLGVRVAILSQAQRRHRGRGVCPLLRTLEKALRATAVDGLLASL